MLQKAVSVEYLPGLAVQSDQNSSLGGCRFCPSVAVESTQFELDVEFASLSGFGY